TLGDTDRDAIATALVTAIGDGDYSPRGMADAAVRVVNRLLADRAPASATAEPKPWRGTCGQIGHPGACQCDGTTDVTCGGCGHPAGGHYGIGGCTAVGPDGEPSCDCQRAGADIRMSGQ
ncbi:hypothetical protein MXD62_10180, partial [Frankia sp. Mgl5]